MTVAEDIVIHVSGNKVTLQCRNSDTSSGWLILGLLAFSVSMAIFRPNMNADFSYWIGLIFSLIIFVPFGFFIILPREITTTFDVFNKSMTLETNYASGRHIRRREVPFDQIRGIGLQEYKPEYKDNEFSYMPVVQLRSGKQFYLATSNGRYLPHQDVINRVSAETGLPLLTLPAK
jgi:hypothetical protein